MTMKELAEASGVDLSTLWRLETTPGRIGTMEILVPIADALGIHPQELLPKRLRRPLPPVQDNPNTGSESSAA